MASIGATYKNSRDLSGPAGPALWLLVEAGSGPLSRSAQNGQMGDFNVPSSTHHPKSKKWVCPHAGSAEKKGSQFNAPPMGRLHSRAAPPATYARAARGAGTKGCGGGAHRTTPKDEHGHILLANWGGCAPGLRPRPNTPATNRAWKTCAPPGLV